MKRSWESSQVLKKFNESISWYIQTLKIPVFQYSNILTNDYKEQTQNLKDIIGSFVNHSKYSKILRASKRKVDQHVQKFISLVDKWWKSYSHQLFYELEKVIHNLFLTDYLKLVCTFSLYQLNLLVVSSIWCLYLSIMGSYHKSWWYWID